MSTTITVLDQTTSERTAESLELQIPSGPVTPSELIRMRVQNEVEEFNRGDSKVFSGLVQPLDTEVVLNGYRLRHHRTLDWQSQYEKAIHSFQRNGFVVIVDHQQVEHLDEPLLLSEKSTIRFLRLVPLIGG